MNRQQRRQRERLTEKAMRRTYSYEECKEISIKYGEDIRKMTQMETAKKYEEIYTVAIACALNAEPFKFGRKRLTDFMKILYSQLESYISGAVDYDSMVELAKSLGVTVRHDNEHFEVNIDDKKVS